ncbi:Similar to HS2ST1: Heparan sulfate 2-O-sulfotransferase 1 (Gallus gallus) [Cotesia congregata]|uniref:Similar to HS2ST1: Heparan sulfate 2-O-sulfotransferase 1 (Gallus gallus) n=1 Tax=Cotesia congregata TaxID=51543 RepID=A0A8J2EHP6_COTCN|nr:Similar to HS2ST1: Heparan sulfate 2-O-sulfotransferase 1 (Gallus gallus) [Cotesia congregata]
MRRVKSFVVIIFFLSVFLIFYASRPVVKNESTEVNYYTQLQRIVTPSLAELGFRGVSKPNDDIIMLTRIPNAGAEILVYILQHLSGYNAFKHIRIPANKHRVLSSLHQELMVEEITSIIKQEAVPLSFDGDIKFLNFKKFDRQAPTFISLVRDPRDILLKHFLDMKINQKKITKVEYHIFAVKIHVVCNVINKWALEQAKKNVLLWYPVVGILELMEETLKVLTNQFGYFFNGAIDIYIKKFRFRNTVKKKRKINDKVKIEVEFYLWLKSRLLSQTYKYL